MTFNIKFDYTFDTVGFFNDPQRKQTLEQAGQYWSAIIQDEFTDLFSSGNFTQVSIASVSYSSPTEYTITEEFKTVTLQEPIDDIVIYVYGLDLPATDSTLGAGGPSGSFQAGSAEEARYTGSDFEPWIGSIYFNQAKNFYFDANPQTEDVPANQIDFFTVAIHEIAHVLGFGTSEAFQNLVVNQQFTGTETVEVNGGQNIPISDDVGHIDPNFSFNGTSALLMNPELGEAKIFPSSLELAMLQDIGYAIYDQTIYLASYNDLLTVFSSNAEAAGQHYLNYGIFEGRSPNIFDPSQYLATHGDLLTVLGNNAEVATEHFILYGFTEGRLRDNFQEDVYLASHDDLIQAFGYDLDTATQHYLNYGFSEERSLNLFNPSQYLASYDSLLEELGNNPEASTKHFIESGFSAGFSRDNFQEDIYLASYGDLIEAFGYNLEAATQHYLNYGFSEGRGKGIFDPVAYLSKNSDVETVLGNNPTVATWHYITYGYAEGRTWILG